MRMVSPNDLNLNYSIIILTIMSIKKLDIRTGEDIIKQCFILLLIPSHPYSTGFNNNPNMSEKSLLPHR